MVIVAWCELLRATTWDIHVFPSCFGDAVLPIETIDFCFVIFLVMEYEFGMVSCSRASMKLH